MSKQTRRSFVRKSAITTVGVGALASGVGTAAESDAEKIPASEIETEKLDSATIEQVSDDVTTEASWPVGTDFDGMPPGAFDGVESPAIVEGAYYEFDLQYSPQHSVDIGFVDTATEKFHYASVSDSDTHNVKATVSIPEDSAAVAVGNPSDSSRDISGSLDVTN
ncbi:hypothetical protein [Halorussus pelagicus]|uniref:hypothetical protein n=1 Tax=Halorussus pelagicus TaxID=2505977 RepID=UPI000FFC3241|nr:hypothetical protein [Halorussus pelagicus]